MPFINTKDEEKYKIVDEILSAPNYYRVLGVQKHATTEDIRRAYIKKSRICHPDKFVPSYPAATESFQILSMAYETLSNPALKSIYDVSKPVNQSPKNYSSGYKQSNAEATFSNVLHQLYTELSTGEFQLIRSFICK
jgi:curved DNA-binding protein CbpA